MTRQITLHRAFDPASPDWLHLIPAGTFSGADGRGPYVVKDATALIAASMTGGKLPLDENHATDFAAPEGRPSPARGWIVALEARADGVWGRVEWNSAGKALIDDKAYRGVSPVLVSDAATGEVLQILRASLTNTPNLPLKTLHTRSHDMDLAPLRAALGLKDDADAAAITAAVTSLHARAEAGSAALAAIAEAAGEDKSADAARVTATVKTLHTAKEAARAEAGDAGQLRATVVSLQSQLDTLQAAAAKDKATHFVDEAIKAGKPIKALRDHYIARHAKDPASVEKEIGALASINAGGVIHPPQKASGAGEASGLSVDEVVAKATAHQKKLKAEGVDIEFGAAVRFVTAS